MRRIGWGGLVAAGLATLAGAQTPQPSVQQAFEAATKASDGDTPAAALPMWEQLEARAASNKRTVAIVRVRKGLVLLRLGRFDDALASIRAGLADLPAADRTLAEDRVEAQLAVGDVLERGLDYAGALAAYRVALASATDPLQRLRGLRGVGETGIFVDPALAGQAIGDAQKILADIKTDDEARALFLSLQSRLLANRGDFAGAYAAANQATKLLGGLMKERVSQADLATRWDAAFAALKLGHEDDARRLIAYTGAGQRVDKIRFPPPRDAVPPECGGEDRLNPADVAVVQVSFDANGTVTNSQPIYSAGGAGVALAFARAAREWSWSPEEAQKLKPFWRAGVRVEMRCSTAFERPGVSALLTKALDDWLADHGLDRSERPGISDAAALPRERAALATLMEGKGTESLALVPALHALATNSVVSREERAAFAQRELAILDAAKAPAVARLAAFRSPGRPAPISGARGRVTLASRRT